MWLFRGHDDVIKWKHFPRYWPFVRGIHRWPVNSPHKGQWRGALMFSLICAWINGWVNNREAGDLRRHRPHYDVTVMTYSIHQSLSVFKQVSWWTNKITRPVDLNNACEGRRTSERRTRGSSTAPYDLWGYLYHKMNANNMNSQQYRYLR